MHADANTFTPIRTASRSTTTRVIVRSCKRVTSQDSTHVVFFNYNDLVVDNLDGLNRQPLMIRTQRGRSSYARAPLAVRRSCWTTNCAGFVSSSPTSWGSTQTACWPRTTPSSTRQPVRLRRTIAVPSTKGCVPISSGRHRPDWCPRAGTRTGSLQPTATVIK